MNKTPFLLLLFCATTATEARAAYSTRTVSIGHSWDLGAVDTGDNVTLPAPSDLGAIVGIGIAGSNEHVYAWYADGTVSSGISTNFEYYQGRQTFTLPDNKSPWDIIAMSIASNDHVYTWYADGTVSEGWSQDLDFYGSPQPFSVAANKTIADIAGIGIADNDHVYTWYADGTVSEGWSQDLDHYAAPYAYVVPAGKKIGHIIDVDIAKSGDLVYAWYHDVEAGSGHSAIADQVDARAMELLRRYALPGLSVSASKSGRVVLEKGYGFRDYNSGDRMDPTSRCRIGSVSKVITALSAMHLDQTRPDFSVNDLVYGPAGALPANIYLSAQDQGVRRHQPIVSKAIASNDRVYTWYHNGIVTSGSSTDPDLHTGPLSYTPASGMTPEDIRAIAIAPNDWVWAFYEDGTFSAGTSRFLESRVPRDPDVKVDLPSGYGVSHVLDLDFASNGDLYVWYDDGMQSAGTTTDFDATIAPRSYTVTPGKSRYFIRGIGIAKSNNHVYTWYNDDTVSQGSSRDLDSHAGPIDYDVPGHGVDASKDWHDWYEDMRVDHLMSHSAGFTRSGDIPAAAVMFSTIEDLLGYQHVHEYMLRTRKLLFAPGTGESYSNHGAGLVGHIVATVSGMSFHDYARDMIIDPLGLNIRTGAQTADDMYRHYVDGSGDLVAYVDDDTNDLGLAAGGWKSSAGDLVRLMLATDGEVNHADILSPATLTLMESRPYPGASSFAHGWDRDNSGKLAHSGGLGGGTTYIAKFPVNYIDGSSAEITVAACTNLSFPDAQGNPLVNLVGDVAFAVDRASINAGYDLY